MSFRITGVIIVTLTAAPIFGAGPFDGKRFKGRIAYSADGNHNDPDDWAASPVALAIFAEAGVKDRLVHFDYNSILPQTNPEWERIHATSVLGAAERYGYDKSRFHDCRKQLDTAVASIARAINNSSAEDPLYFIIAGPMQVPFLGIQKSDPKKRKFVYSISHSPWNDGFAPKYTFTHTKRSVIAAGVHWVQIQDQNRLLSRSRYGQPAQPQEFEPYFWMRDSKDPKVRFLWEKMVVSTRPDPSDAGMAYFLVTGDEQADPAKLKRLLDDRIVPKPIAERAQVRLEAENFRVFENYEVEYRNDRGASHKVNVKLGNSGVGRIRTLFDEPYIASKGIVDVDVRYFDEKGSRSKFALFVNGVLKGEPWNSSLDDDGWKTRTISGVSIQRGAEIVVEVEGQAGGSGRLDYVQLNFSRTASMRAAGPPPPGRRLTVGIVQMAVEPHLDANRDKIVRYIPQAKARGCRLAVFPEGALTGGPLDDPPKTQAAVERIRQAAREAGIYVMFGGHTAQRLGEKPFNWMKVLDPSGHEIFQYEKLYDRHTAKMPGVFFIDGIPCNAMICADRWLRGIEELPIMEGAQVSFELSNNFASEWVPELGWYWYVPRALRNNVFVVFANTSGPGKHGHSAVIDPAGGIVSSSGGNYEELLVAALDTSKASRAEARRRLEHPVFRSYWETGLKLLKGERVAVDPQEQFVSPQVEIKVAAAQMACSRVVAENVAKMGTFIQKASSEGADVVVFPELAVTGALDGDIAHADAKILNRALERLREATRAAKIYSVFGSPSLDGSARRNSALVIGPDGAVLTRYDQLVTDRTRLFRQGSQLANMWFEVKGVPGVVTIGSDGLWSEIAEMAALAGAQLHLHISYSQDTGPDEAQRRLQVWANLASFRTFAATVNAASPRGIPSPSAVASGGSALWDDLDSVAEIRLAVSEQHRKPGHELLPIYSPFSANCVAKAGQEERLLSATCRPNRNNVHRSARHNPSMAAWYAFGARLVVGGRDLARRLPAR